jgi:hypothetical protein
VGSARHNRRPRIIARVDSLRVFGYVARGS